MGGLGNQLFQYAFSRSLSHDLKTDLFLDLSYFYSERLKRIRHEDYALKYYKIPAEIASDEIKEDMVDTSNLNYYDEAVFREITDFPPLKNINNIRLPAYLEGYWQTEKYFIHNTKLIKKDLQLMTPLKGKNKEVAKHIKGENSVAMHIRRGDYHFNSHLGMCSIDYYKKAVSFLDKQIDDPKFFIFSDDHHWVKENIHIPHPSYHVEHNDVDRGYEDLRLMSLCENFIIANSSFSWWGAWLSDNDDKMIITPQPWFTSRDPHSRYIDQGKHFYPILNDYREIFNQSNQVLFTLNPDNHISDIPSTSEVELSVRENHLNINTLGDDSKLYIKCLKKFNDDNDVVMRISLKSASSDVMRLYYTTLTSSKYNMKDSFFFHYYEDEADDVYIHLPGEVLLTKLMIVPATNKGSQITITGLEIREISDSQIIPEKTPPTILCSDPANGATDVALNKDIHVTFDDNIKKGPYDWIELKSADGDLQKIKKSIEGNILTIIHPKLLINTRYTLMIHTGTLSSLTGDPIEPKSIIFTTGTSKERLGSLSSFFKKITGSK